MERRVSSGQDGFLRLGQVGEQRPGGTRSQRRFGCRPKPARVDVPKCSRSRSSARCRLEAPLRQDGQVPVPPDLRGGRFRNQDLRRPQAGQLEPQGRPAIAARRSRWRQTRRC